MINGSSKRRARNALKHGAYTKDFVLPTEDRSEFHALYRELAHELKPDGALQREHVLIIAGWMWRRRRINRLISMRRLIATEDHSSIVEEPSQAISAVNNQIATLRATHSAVRMFGLAVKWARVAVDSANSHLDLNGIKNELENLFGIDSPLLGQEAGPRDLGLRKQAFAFFIDKELGHHLQSFVESERKRADRIASEIADRLFPGDPRAEVELEARINAELDKAVRRYVQLRAAVQAMKTLDHQGAAQPTVRPKSPPLLDDVRRSER